MAEEVPTASQEKDGSGRVRQSAVSAAVGAIVGCFSACTPAIGLMGDGGGNSVAGFFLISATAGALVGMAFGATQSRR
jgi:hypothetical protein